MNVMQHACHGNTPVTILNGNDKLITTVGFQLKAHLRVDRSQGLTRHELDVEALPEGPKQADVICENI